jgi:prophage regulatory protein
METDKLLRRQDVLDRVGLSRSALYDAMARHGFPRPLRIGRRAVAWSENAINLWIASRPSAGKGVQA